MTIKRFTPAAIAAALVLALHLPLPSRAEAGTAKDSPAAVLDGDHPTETVQQSQTSGQVNGLPSQPHFLTQQDTQEWLASSLLNQPVLNAMGEEVGNIKDIVTDGHGTLVGIVIGVGGFLGIGEKDVAVRSSDLRIFRDDQRRVKVMGNLTKESLTAAPSFQGLAAAGVPGKKSGL